MSDDDAFLRVALNIDYRTYVYVALVFLERLHADFNRVRYLLVVIEQNLLAYYLAHKETCRFVGELVFVKIRRRVGQQLLNALQQHVDAKLILGRYGQNLSIGQQLMPQLNQVAELLLVALVNLVDKQEHRNGHLAHFPKEVHVLFGILYHVGYIEQHISVFKCRLRESQHRLLQFIVRLEHSRGVGEHYLHVVRVDNAHYTVARGLRLECGNAYALAHELVHKRRLAHVRITYNVYKSCLVHLYFCFA